MHSPRVSDRSRGALARGLTGEGDRLSKGRGVQRLTSTR